MKSHDVFALKNANVDAFLFAEVGTEANGSALTVLSLLARLDEDPWSVASAWALLPKPAVIERLAERIARMPLDEQALRDARSTAARISLLLPAQDDAFRSIGNGTVRLQATPPIIPKAVFYCAIAIGMAMNVMTFALPDRPAAPTTALMSAPIGAQASAQANPPLVQPTVPRTP